MESLPWWRKITAMELLSSLLSPKTKKNLFPISSNHFFTALAHMDTWRFKISIMPRKIYRVWKVSFHWIYLIYTTSSSAKVSWHAITANTKTHSLYSARQQRHYPIALSQLSTKQSLLFASPPKYFQKNWKIRRKNISNLPCAPFAKYKPSKTTLHCSWFEACCITHSETLTLPSTIWKNIWIKAPNPVL